MSSYGVSKTEALRLAATSDMWTLTNPILANGAIGAEIDTNKAKIGDGVSTWSQLSYLGTSSGTYTLPAATTSALGGVKVSNGLNITAGGALSAAVLSVAGRTGAITLSVSDVAGAAPVANPTFTGTVTIPAGAAISGYLTTTAASTTYAPLASPALSGTPTAPTPANGDNSTAIATTAFVQASLSASMITLAGSNITLSQAQYSSAQIIFQGELTANVVVTFPTSGNWAVINQTTGDFTITLSNGSGATSVLPADVIEYAISAGAGGIVISGVASFNNRTGVIVPDSGDYTVSQVTGAAPIASPTFTGTVTIPAGAAISGYLTSATASSTYAPKASPTFTGTVTIPAGASIAGFAPLASPALTGTPTAITAAAGTNTTQIATTQFVTTAVANSAYTLPAATTSTIGGLQQLEYIAPATGGTDTVTEGVLNALLAQLVSQGLMASAS